MRAPLHNIRGLLCSGLLFCLSSGVLGWVEAVQGAQPASATELPLRPSDKSEIDLAAIPFKIIYETYRNTDGKENWELILMNADGTGATNLTRTPDVDEMYPHASPDGTKVCFVADEDQGNRKVRNVYYMNIDGTDRVRIADHAREPCWSPNGKTIAYLQDEYDRYTTKPYATKGLSFYDIATAQREQHPNTDLLHVYNICWAPQGKWFVSSAVGGMGMGNDVVAFEAHGSAVFGLAQYGIKGCRPDISADGKKITWGRTNWDLCIADIDLTLPVPRVANVREVVRCGKDCKVYHTDFSPDGRYIAFSYGPEAGSQEVGRKAPGWNICVADLTGKWTQVTTDGKNNKEPDWVPIGPSTK
jgi:Tol biopolymer transport system component